jgi:hypothetical protein
MPLNMNCILKIVKKLIVLDFLKDGAQLSDEMKGSNNMIL